LPSNDLLTLALRAARKAGQFIIEQTSRSGHIKDVAARELVTESDRQAERLIRDEILNSRSGDGFLGEEFGYVEGETGYTWVVDPIDGTTNYTHHLPEFCVSIAVLQDGTPKIGVVFDPNRDMCYSAVLSEGAFCNGRQLHAIPSPLTPQTLFGFSTRFIDRRPDHVLKVLDFCDEYRNLGSAALHLCYTAQNWLDGTFADSTRLWDVAAGGLILTEAGGGVLNFQGDPLFPLKDDIEAYTHQYVPIVATNGGPDASMLRRLFSDGPTE
jgi:myo-inositol-1(or 4)-monophosphatase